MKVFFHLVLPLILILLCSQNSVVQGRLLSISTKPDPKDAAATARWLVSKFMGMDIEEIVENYQTEPPEIDFVGGDLCTTKMYPEPHDKRIHWWKCFCVLYKL
ncbi:hypothetical protein MTR_8g106160 [Medicago truncatula]|uniref:Transmembrane protein n=1 Tax=Medicago truncatula TaxID=3880 RepID=G7LCC5_MEDTR|nr:hypothetical protein MTR_8g106160 [Medicago truncatula]